MDDTRRRALVGAAPSKGDALSDRIRRFLGSEYVSAGDPVRRFYEAQAAVRDELGPRE